MHAVHAFRKIFSVTPRGVHPDISARRKPQLFAPLRRRTGKPASPAKKNWYNFFGEIYHCADVRFPVCARARALSFGVLNDPGINTSIHNRSYEREFERFDVYLLAEAEARPLRAAAMREEPVPDCRRNAFIWD